MWQKEASNTIPRFILDATVWAQCEQKAARAANGSEIIRSHNKIKKCPRNKRKASEIRRKGLRSDAVWAALIVFGGQESEAVDAALVQCPKGSAIGIF